MKKLFSGRNLALLVLISLAVLAMPFSAMGKEKKINISYSIDLTGPLSVGIKPILTAALDYWRMVNEAGGIQGVNVNPLWADTSYSLPKCLTAYKRFRQRGTIVHNTANSTENENLKDKWAKDKVLVVTAAYTAPCVEPPGWVYTPTIFYEEEFCGVLDYIKKIYKGNRNPKFGVLTYDIPATKTWRDIYPSYGKHIGVDVKIEICPLNPMDLTTQLSRLKTWGADYVFVLMMSGDPALGLKDSKKIGFNTTLISGYEPYTIDLAGDLSDGMLMMSDVSIFSENVPGNREIREILMKYHGKDAIIKEIAYSRGWVQAKVIHRALEIALKDVGFKKISGTAVKAAMHKIKDLDTGGLTLPLNWADNPNKRIGAEAFKFYEVQKGKLVPMSGWEPYARWEELKRVSGWKPK